MRTNDKLLIIISIVLVITTGVLVKTINDLIVMRAFLDSVMRLNSDLDREVEILFIDWKRCREKNRGI